MGYSKLAGARVLITGGAGFIGSNLCESFLQAGNEVVCLDNFVTGNITNVQPFLKMKGFELIEGDIRDPADCARAMRGVDVVLQQAALGSVPRSINDPAATNEVNVSGFLNVLIAARDARVKRFVYAGSSSVYGDRDELPKVEERIGKPLSPYAVTKLVDELYAEVFAKTYGMEIIGLRYFNVFGKGQDPAGEYAAAIPKFIQALIMKESPLIHGDGSNSRDFTYVQNVVQMNHLAAGTKNPAAFGEVFNTASGKSATLKELVSLLKELLAVYDPEITEVKVNYGRERKGDIPHSLASIEKARSLLNYDPSHGLREGLAEAIKWYWERFAAL